MSVPMRNFSHHVSLRVLTLYFLVWRSKYLTFEAHVWFRALALEQPNREILIRDTQVHVSTSYSVSPRNPG